MVLVASPSPSGAVQVVEFAQVSVYRGFITDLTGDN
jgi:hypothetical protein